MKVKIEEKVEADDRQKRKIEEKVEDSKQKGKLKDEVIDDRRKKGKIEEEGKVIKSKSHTYTLRQRHNNQSKVTASFEKILTNTDVNQRLKIPTHFMQHLPNKERGGNVYLNVLDTSSAEQFQFSYYTRSSGNPNPVFQGGWKEYCRNKGLEPGDRITFECPSYTIHAQRKVRLMGAEVWLVLP